MAAEFITFAALVGACDHIVSAASLYGGTVTQLDVTLRRFGVETTFVPGTDPADYAAAIRPETKVVYAEMIANPSGEIADIVIHSETKFLGGHGTTLGGIVIEGGRFSWGNGKFPQMTETVPSYGGVRW